MGLLVAASGLGQLASAAAIAYSRGLRYHGRVLLLGSLLVIFPQDLPISKRVASGP